MGAGDWSGQSQHNPKPSNDASGNTKSRNRLLHFKTDALPCSLLVARLQKFANRCTVTAGTRSSTRWGICTSCDCNCELTLFVSAIVCWFATLFDFIANSLFCLIVAATTSALKFPTILLQLQRQLRLDHRLRSPNSFLCRNRARNQQLSQSLRLLRRCTLRFVLASCLALQTRQVSLLFAACFPVLLIFTRS